MLASKTKFAFNLVQRSLLIRSQYSIALGSETPRFYPKNPPSPLKKDAGSKLSFEELAEECITIYDCEELAIEAVAIYGLEKPAEQAIETVQNVIEEIEERIDQVNECAKEVYSFDSFLGCALDRLDTKKQEVDRVIAGMSEKVEQIALKAHEIEELANEAVETVQYAIKKFKDDTKGEEQEELKGKDHKQ